MESTEHLISDLSIISEWVEGIWYPSVYQKRNYSISQLNSTLQTSISYFQNTLLSSIHNSKSQLETSFLLYKVSFPRIRYSASATPVVFLHSAANSIVGPCLVLFRVCISCGGLRSHSPFGQSRDKCFSHQLSSFSLLTIII